MNKAVSALMTSLTLLVLYGLGVYLVWDVNLANPGHWQSLYRTLTVLQIGEYRSALLAFLGLSLVVILVGLPAATAAGIMFLSGFWSGLLRGIARSIAVPFRLTGKGIRIGFEPARKLLGWRPPVKVNVRLAWKEDRPTPPPTRQSPEKTPEPVMEITAGKTVVSEDSQTQPADKPAASFGLSLDVPLRPASRIIPTLRDFFHSIDYECRLDIGLNPAKLGDAAFTPDEFGDDPFIICDMIAFGADQIIIIQTLDLLGQEWQASVSADSPEWNSHDGDEAPCPIYRAARAMRRFKQQFAGSLNLQADELMALVIVDNGTLSEEDGHVDAVSDYAASQNVEIAYLGAPGALESLFVKVDSPYPVEKIDYISSLAAQIST